MPAMSRYHGSAGRRTVDKRATMWQARAHSPTPIQTQVRNGGPTNLQLGSDRATIAQLEGNAPLIGNCRHGGGAIVTSETIVSSGLGGPPG